MATIKPIEGRSVHQIQSGQVIVDLISVCKELIENSVDAGATSIEVRFRNNGLDAIEVQDNGSGISPEDYDTIALKHYTSKLSTYDDLSSLQTFGFRGEALSSLCALSKFYIITARASDGPKGTKLEFEQSGKLKGTSVVAAKQGTTVVVETLFHNLPVRRKELEKNIKRQYSKVLEMLNAYACISTGVKIVVSNQIPKGKKTVAFATNGNANTKENIANVYGAKALSSLIPLSLQFEMDISSRPGSTHGARNWSTQEDGGSHKVEIVGHISRPVAGEGRQLPDRQMFFVNSRPCDLPQVRKAFTEVYKTYNLSQSPFVFANIKLDTNAYDVNVSPDKRSIMLHDQAALLESLKDALTELFEGHDQSVPQAQLLDKRTPSASAFKPPTMQPRASTMSVSAELSDPIPPSLPRSSSTHSEPSESPLRSEESLRPGFVKASMIERFAGRDPEEIPNHLLTRRKRKSPEQDENSEASAVAPTSLSYIASSEASDATRRGHDQREQSPLFEPDNESTIEALLQEKETDSIEVNSEHKGSQHIRSVTRLSQVSEDSNNIDDGDEEQIPAVVQTPQRFMQSSIQNAFDRMRPLRTPVQQATITIGDTTTTSTIGGGSESRAAKRARIHTPKFSLSGAPLSQTPKRSSIMKSLRGFSAPGTQMEVSDDDDEQDEERRLPIAHGRSPSPQKELPVRDPESAVTDTDDISSSSQPAADLTGVNEDEEDTEVPAPLQEAEDDDSDQEYIDESEQKAREEAKIAQMIQEAEAAAAMPTDENLKRATKLFRNSVKKYSTTNLESTMRITPHAIREQVARLDRCRLDSDMRVLAQRDAMPDRPSSTQLNNEDAEERLSLTVTKSDFSDMRIIGQFNLGFILAVRPPTATSPSSDLFIIDQHASDEKYNFERLSTSTVLVSQRLVHPHPLELTAVEEELILANNPSLTANGFAIELDTSGATQTGHRARLTSLPMSKEVTFTPTDLEELLALIMDSPPSSSLSTSPHIPRPSKIRKLLASRACRGSVMIGKTLKKGKMEEIVRHMGSMDKPWSCPHGRPTMRHLFGLEKWDGWVEGSGVRGLGEEAEKVNWGAYLKGMRK